MIELLKIVADHSVRRYNLWCLDQMYAYYDADASDPYHNV